MLRRPIKGAGGFQDLMRRIQHGLRGHELLVDQADIDALLRATIGPAVGGFQRRARNIVADAVMQSLRAEGFRIRDDDPPARLLYFHGEQRRLPFGEDE